MTVFKITYFMSSGSIVKDRVTVMQTCNEEETRGFLTKFDSILSQAVKSQSDGQIKLGIVNVNPKYVIAAYVEAENDDKRI